MSTAVAAMAVAAFAWAAPREEPAEGFRAYLDRAGPPVLLEVSGASDVSVVTASTSDSGFLKGISGIPDRGAAGSVAAEAESLGGDVRVQRSMSSWTAQDGTTQGSITAGLVTDRGYLKAAEVGYNGLALWYSPPMTQLPSDITVGTGWRESGTVNGFAAYEHSGRIERSPREGCLVTATTTRLIVEGSEPLVTELETTWCRGLGGVSSVDVASGRTVSVSAGSVAPLPPDRRPPRTPALVDALPLPLLSPSVVMPAVVLGDVLVEVVATTGDLVAVDLDPAPIPAGDDPRSALPLSWMQHPGGDVLGIATDGRRVFPTTTDRRILSFSRAGGLLWSSQLPDVAVGSPTVFGGLVVAAGLDGSVTALDTATGERRWSRSMTDAVVADPVATGSTVVVADIAGRVAAVDSAGSVQWSVDLDPVTTALSSLHDGSVLVVDDSDTAHLIDPRGEVVWQAQLPGSSSGPAVLTGDVIVVPTAAALVGLRASDGQTAWEQPEWSGARAWATSEGTVITLADRLGVTGSDGRAEMTADRVTEPDGSPARDLQILDLGTHRMIVTSTGALVPWPGGSA